MFMVKNIFSEAVAQRCFMEKVFLETSQNSQENTSAKVSFLIKLACTFIKKETLAQLFSCEVFCKKGVLRKLTKFTGKHLCQSLFFNKAAGLVCSFNKK